MKHVASIFVAGVTLSTAASPLSCSSGPSTPQDACRGLVSATCQKEFACYDASTLDPLLGYSSESDCVTRFEANADCSTATCPQGTTFDSAMASSCINDINAETCDQALSTPSSCKVMSFCR